MLPQEVKPEKGSRMVLNGVEVWIIHNFTTERGNVLETVGETFILPNGEPVRDKSILECLPDQHKGRALAWWESRYGAETIIEPVPETPESIRVQIETLSEKLAVMEGGEAQTEVGPMELKEGKPKVRVKRDKGLETLKQMGLGA